MEQPGGMDAWHRAVAAIAFTMQAAGEVSPVTVRPEGVFLVRLLDRKPAMTTAFEAVSAQLEQEERARIRDRLESEFQRTVEAAHPIE